MQQKKYSPLEQSILKTIVYFDCLDRALTATEVYFYLASTQGLELNHSFLDIVKALERGLLLRREYVDEKNGYYFLQGRAHLYEGRIERLKTADRLWKKMRRIARWMQMVPYIRLVMASGSLGMEHMTVDSDLDVLVVVKQGRIWTGRFLLTTLMHVLGVRRHGKHIAGRVCLNHYITDQSLSIPFHSLYNAMTYAQLVPIYERPNKKPAREADLLRSPSVVPGKNPSLSSTTEYSQPGSFVKGKIYHSQDVLEARGIEPPDPWMISRGRYHAAPRIPVVYQEEYVLTALFNDFQQANEWIRDYLPNWQPGRESLRTLPANPFHTGIVRCLEWWLDSVWGDLLEGMLRRAQLKRIERRPETHAGGGRVRADDMMLEFHPNSPEKTIIGRFNRKAVELDMFEMAAERDSGLS